MGSGEIKNSEIKKNRDGENDVRLLKVEITDPDDVQTVEHMTQAGEDNCPPDGAKVIIISIGEAWKIAVCVDDGIAPEVAKGERKLYSSDGGSIQAFVHLKKDGTIVLNSEDDNAVRFSKLKEAFDDLKQQWNTFANAYAPGGPTVQGTPPTALPCNKSIDPAKVDNITVPGAGV